MVTQKTHEKIISTNYKSFQGANSKYRVNKENKEICKIPKQSIIFLQNFSFISDTMGGISGFLTNFPPFFYFLLSLLERIPVKLPMQIEKMVSRVSYPRTGRHLQRYDNRGFRLVVGCIPYRFRKSEDETSNDEVIEVLVISAQNGRGMLFPKGGWEKDESMEEAAIRETLEEAGVLGSIECSLGKWSYKSKRQSIFHEGHMFPLLVKQELDCWPEKNIRKRKWVTVSKAREECPNLWMREALEELVRRHMQPLPKEEVNKTACN